MISWWFGGCCLLTRDFRFARILCGTYIPSKRWFEKVAQIIPEKSAPECPFECGWGGAKAKRAMPKCPPREFEGGFPIHKADFELCEWDIQSAAVVEGVWDAALSRPEWKYAIMKYTREIDTLGQNKRVFWAVWVGHSISSGTGRRVHFGAKINLSPLSHMRNIAMQASHRVLSTWR